MYKSSRSQQVFFGMKNSSSAAAARPAGGIIIKRVTHHKKKEFVAKITKTRMNLSHSPAYPYRPLQFNEMPDDCIRAILDHLPLQTLVSICRAVCSLWRELIEDLIQRRAKSLLLFDGCVSPSISIYPGLSARLFHDIDLVNIVYIRFDVVNLSADVGRMDLFRQFVLRLFPRPEILILRFYNSIDYFPHLVHHLLSGWSSHLVTFSLMITQRTKAADIAYQASNFLNTCARLERLDLLVAANHVSFFIRPAILKSLSHFSCDSNRSIFDDLHLLLETDAGCRRIWYGELDTYHLAQNILARCDYQPDYQSRLTHLHLNIGWVEVLDRLAYHFISLRMLSLYSRDGVSAPFDGRLLQILAPLTNLVELKLDWFLIDYFHIPIDQIHVPLGSVRILSWGCFQVQPSGVPFSFYPTLAAYFPNLEELLIESYGRTDLGHFAQFLSLFPHLKKHITP